MPQLDERGIPTLLNEKNQDTKEVIKICVIIICKSKNDTLTKTIKGQTTFYNILHITYKTKDRVTRTPQTIGMGVGLGSFQMVSS
jgi:hypothetical protein